MKSAEDEVSVARGHGMRRQDSILVRQDSIRVPDVDNAATIDTRARAAVMTIGIDIDDTRPMFVALDAIQLAESDEAAAILREMEASE